MREPDPSFCNVTLFGWQRLRQRFGRWARFWRAPAGGPFWHEHPHR